MECIECGGATIVTDSRKNSKLRRRRVCKDCNLKFTTYELTHSDILELVDEAINDKLLDSISKALDYNLPTHDPNDSKVLAKSRFKKYKPLTKANIIEAIIDNPNLDEAGKELGVSQSTMQRRLKEFELVDWYRHHKKGRSA